ncbi:MAG TPA: CocE/NonD family hydrolase, partial [Thermoanaerobaculia bacterium]|nr:CocE/NonD family hydrolase [Thermoanaerobaculia bacterium]
MPAARGASGLAVCGLTLALVGAALGLPGALAGQPPAAPEDPIAAYVRSHYTKREVRIPMRDGERLFTAVYTPNDAGAAPGEGKRYPILINRTPYGVAPYGAAEYPQKLGPAAPYAEEGFIFVSQDVRGRFMSEGEFVDMRPAADPPPGGTNEATDTYDTIEWLLAKVPGHNGKVGLWGISYPGFYASAGAID